MDVSGLNCAAQAAVDAVEHLLHYPCLDGRGLQQDERRADEHDYEAENAGAYVRIFPDGSKAFWYNQQI